jgi:hypothetical protein
MSYKVKGHPGPWLQQERYTFDPAEARWYRERTWAGSARAIQGQALQLRSIGIGFESILEERGVGYTFERTPLNTATGIETSDIRYEIATEFIEQDIFRHKTVSDAADAFDAALGPAGLTFRKVAEDAIDEATSAADPILNRVITHLRRGYTGFEREYIVLRRSRRIPFYGKGSAVGKARATILDGRFIYTTAQLGVPDVVAFSLPDLTALPISAWTDVQWGWRRRPSSIVYTGDFIEQSSEFILAEWSLLLYEPAAAAASW